jgi:hypothetical protein
MVLVVGAVSHLDSYGDRFFGHLADFYRLHRSRIVAVKHQLFDVWLEDYVEDCRFPWCAQLVENVGHFQTKELAEQYVAFVKKTRENIKVKSR